MRAPLMKQGRMHFMEFQTFVTRLGNDTGVDWDFAFDADLFRLA